jgi:GTP-binding protein HflX
LQEAVDADLLLHVVDAANPHYPEQIQQVQSVLKEIGADAIAQLLVFNKTDALSSESLPLKQEDVFEMDGAQVPRIFVSAKDGSGLALLRQRLSQIARVPSGSGGDGLHSLGTLGDDA